MPVSYLRLTRTNLSQAQWVLDSYGKTYGLVYRDYPWDEWKQCQVCKRIFGFREIRELRHISTQQPITGYQPRESRVTSVSKDFYLHCGQPTLDCWPVSVVKQNLLYDLTVRGAICYLPIAAQTAVGFCIGYTITAGNLERKLQLPGISHRLFQLGTLGYLADLGILEDYRSRYGIAKTILRMLVEDFATLGVDTMVFRTKPTTVLYAWSMKLGFVKIGEYPDGRVIVSRPFPGLLGLLS